MSSRNIRASGVFALAALATGVICAISACAQSPTLPSPDKEVGPAAPRLLSPIDNAVAGRQNDPTSGCPVTDATRGTGMRIDFAWQGVPGAVAYLGCYWRDGGEDLVCPEEQYPYRLLFDSFHTPETQISLVTCVFIQDQVLGDWHWKVAARTADSGWGPYSSPGSFSLTPCRLQDGRACFAPPQTSDAQNTGILASLESYDLVRRLLSPKP